MRKAWWGLAAFLVVSSAHAQEIGPRRGALVIVGGAMRDTAIMERFIELAGGPKAPIVIIPTAGGDDDYDDFYRGAARWREAGVENITILHTKDRNEASSDRFVEPIRKARGVWFPGGRQWRLADSYLDTRTELELHALLDRGGVIGGSSAGATIQGSYLVRGDTKTNTIMMGDHEEGFGFLKKVAIDQHLLARNRQFDLHRGYPEASGASWHRTRRGYRHRRSGRPGRSHRPKLRGDLPTIRPRWPNGDGSTSCALAMCSTSRHESRSAARCLPSRSRRL